MTSDQNPERYAKQSNDFSPWGYSRTTEATVVNETGSYNNTLVYSDSGMKTYSEGWLYIFPMVSTTLLLFGLVGSFLLSVLLFIHNRGNKRREAFTYLLFFPVVFSCILLAAVFFFLMPRIVNQEVDLPRAYDPAFPAPAVGSELGPLAIDGYGSSLYDLRPVGDPDTYTYKVSWSPGYGLYMYFGAFLFAIIGFFFYSKMKRMKGYALEPEQEQVIDAEEVEMEEVSIVETVEDGHSSPEEDEGGVILTVEEEEQETDEPPPPVKETKDRVPATKGSTPEKEASSGLKTGMEAFPSEREEGLAESSLEVHIHGSPGKQSIIELGADDFDGKEEELTIKGAEELTLECPGCSKRFKAVKGETIKCPHCGLEGELD